MVLIKVENVSQVELVLIHRIQLAFSHKIAHLLLFLPAFRRHLVSHVDGILHTRVDLGVEKIVDGAKL